MILIWIESAMIQWKLVRQGSTHFATPSFGTSKGHQWRKVAHGNFTVHRLFQIDTTSKWRQVHAATWHPHPSLTRMGTEFEISQSPDSQGKCQRIALATRAYNLQSFASAASYSTSTKPPGTLKANALRRPQIRCVSSFWRDVAWR